MNKQTRTNLLVGFTSLLTLVLGIFVFLFLRGKLNNDKVIHVVFSNALGVNPGEWVQMAGVQIGQVDAVRLNAENKAEVDLGIRRQFQIPKGSLFTIRSGVLGNTRKLEVIPAPPPVTGTIAEGDTVVGDSTQPLDETLTESKKLLVQGQELAGQLNTIIADPKRQRNLDRLINNSADITEKLNKNLSRTLENTTALTENLRRVSEQLPEMKMQVDVLLADLRTTTASGRRAAKSAEGLASDARGLAGDARTLTQSLTSTVNENRKTVASLVQNADDAAAAVAGLTNEVKGLVGDKKLRDNLTAATDNITITTTNFAAISAKFDKIADNLQKLSGDPALTGDLKATVSNLKETTNSFKNLAARVERLRLPGERGNSNAPTPPGGTPPNTPRPFSATSLLEPGFVFDSLYDTTLRRARADANFTYLAGKSGPAYNFYRLGLFDAGERNRLTLQYGQSSNLSAFAYRYGFIAGKLGLGLDFRAGPLDFRVDAYNPNRGTVNVRAKTNVNRRASLTFGMDAIGRENQAIVGVQVRP